MARPLLDIVPQAPGGLFRVFISSGNEAARVRERLRGLIQEVFNPALADSEQGFQLYPDMWERTAAQRSHGESTNAIFVERALRSHMTIVALIDSLPDGTREELEAVLGVAEIQLAVMRFTTQTLEVARRDELGKYLADNSDKFLYVLREGQDSNEAWYSIVRQILALAVTGMSTGPSGAYTEMRAPLD
jgi:hypothetical protein